MSAIGTVAHTPPTGMTSTAGMPHQGLKTPPDGRPFVPAPPKGRKASYDLQTRSFGSLNYIPLRDIALHRGGRTLVKGLLDDGAMSVIYGESNAGKSFFTMDLALHVAMGRPWEGHRVKQAAVVYVAAEGGHGIENRVMASRLHHSIPPETPFALVPCPVDLLDPDADARPLIDLIAGASAEFGMRVGMVVIDTLSRAIAGGNENSPDAMGCFVRNVDTIRQATGAHIAIVHHSGKDVTKGARGHSLLRAATDTEIELTKGDKNSQARVTKQREGATGKVYPFHLQTVDLGVDNDGDTIASAVVIASATQDESAGDAKRISKSEQTALQFLWDLVAAKGLPLPTVGDFPSGLRGVQNDQWQAECRSRGLSPSDKLDTQRAAFRRAAEGLQKASRIAFRDGWVWAAHSPD